MELKDKKVSSRSHVLIAIYLWALYNRQAASYLFYLLLCQWWEKLVLCSLFRRLWLSSSALIMGVVY